jgi:membrane protein CcdC involved in cytochrome C biogenesis
MNEVNVMYASYGTVVLVILLVLWRRTRAMTRPIRGNGYRILTPMLFLIPGLLLFTNPRLHISAEEVLVSVLAGLVLSIPLVLTTNYEIRADGNIYAKKSIGFIVSFVGLVILRMLLREYISGLEQFTLSTMFFLMAASYVFVWRVCSFVKFRKVWAVQQRQTSKIDA